MNSRPYCVVVEEYMKFCWMQALANYFTLVFYSVASEEDLLNFEKRFKAVSSLYI